MPQINSKLLATRKRQKPTKAILNGLQAYYPLDLFGADRTRNGYNLSLPSYPLTNNGSVTPATGKVGQAAKFAHALSQYLQSTALAAAMSTTTFTIAFWYNLTTVNYCLTGSSNGFNAGWRIFIRDATGFDFVLLNASTSYTFGGAIYGAETVGQWHHFALTFNGATQTAITYKDGGSATNFSTGMSTVDLDTADGVGIGAEGNGFNPMDGLLDEYGIWNRVLSAGEISSLYNGGAGLAYPGVLGALGSSGLVAYYGFNGDILQSSAPVFAASPIQATLNANNLTNNGGVTAAAGKIGNAASFNGTSQYLTHSGVILGSGPCSIAAWVNASAFGSAATIVQLSDTVSLIRLAGNQFRFTADAFGSWSQDPSSITTSGWHHVVAVYDGTSTRLYVDGALVDGPDTVTGTIGATGSVGIGANYSGGQYWNGSIDETGIWGRALSATEITTLYNSGAGLAYSSFASTLVSGLVAYYGFNGTPITSDNAYYRDQAPPLNMSQSYAAEFFSSGSQYASLAHSMFTRDGWALSLWFNLASSPADVQLYALFDQAAKIDIGVLRLSGANRLSLRIDGASFTVSSDVNFAVGAWYHLVVSYTSGTVVSAWVNGVALSALATGGVANYAAGNCYLGSVGASSSFLDGMMTQCLFYSRALSDFEAQNLHNSGRGISNGSVPTNGLVAQYGFGDLARDAGPYGYDLTNSNLVTDVAGAVGRAVNFVSGSLQSLGNVNFPTLNTGSMSFWFQATSGTGAVQTMVQVGQYANHEIGVGTHNANTTIRGYFGTVATGDGFATIPDATVSLNTWNHAVLTWDSNSIVALWINGVNMAAYLTGVTFTNQGFLTIGYHYNAGDQYFTGLVNQLGVWSRVLLPTEIAWLYNSGAGRSNSDF